MGKIRMDEAAVRDGLALAETIDDFDRPLSEMSREELIAIAAFTMDAAKKARVRMRETNKRMLDLAMSNLR